MDISIALCMALTIALGLGIVLLLLILLTKPSSSLNLPPGSLGWPLLGETLEFLATQRANANRIFFEKRNKQYGGDIFKTHLLGDPTAVLYSPAGNRFLFSNENNLVQVSWPSSVAKLFGNSLISKVGDDAKELRKMLLTFLRPEALQKIVGRVDSIVNDHFSRYWVGKQQIKAFPLVKRCFFSVACALFLSLDQGEQQTELYRHFMDLINGMLHIPLDFPGTLYHKARIGSNQIREILQTVIDKRREDVAIGSASSEQDLLSYMLWNADERGNTLTDDDIKDNIMLLLMAGHDTNAVTITFLLKNLCLNPHCYRQILQEQVQITREKEAGREVLQWDDLKKMKYTWRAAQETLRLYPPSAGTWRKAIVDISYRGFTIPKGWKLFWTSNSTHKNAEYFPDPEKFDPTRFEGNGPAPYTFVPFGGGPRMCPGNEFARMVTLVFLHDFVKMFEWDLVDVNEKVIADPFPTPADGLPIKLRPYPLK